MVKYRMQHLIFWIFWSERKVLQRSMPICIQTAFGSQVTVIIDCFKIYTRIPIALDSRATTWSNYKHNNTVKYLVGISPQGVITLISKGWGGRASDKHIVENCGLLDNILPGYVILADQGFTISDSVAVFGAKLQMPAFTKGKSQLKLKELEETREIANV